MPGSETKRELRRVTVATVRTMADAQRIKVVLEGERIESFLATERAVATSRSAKPKLAAIVIQVDRPQVARAVEVLRAHSDRVRGEAVAPMAVQGSRSAKAASVARTAVPAAAALAAGLALAWLLLN